MDKNELQKRMEQAIRLTAPGQPIRTALDMIIAGHLGALICVGDTENVLAAGNDGFPLNISFTSNRLFELSKMDGAIVIDGDLTQILRANFHLNPDPSLATSETGMRHRTAARMSVLTDAIVISVSARRAVVNVYVHGKSYEIQPVTTIMSSVNQLVATLQTTRQSLDRSLLRLTALELDDYVTLADITGIFSSFEIMQQAKTELKDCIVKLGNQGKLVQMQLEQLAGSSMDTEYDLMIRDYASDSSEANAEKIRANLSRMTPKDLSDPQHVAAVLGYDDLDEDSVMTPLGLRTLSRVSVVRDGVAEKSSTSMDRCRSSWTTSARIRSAWATLALTTLPSCGLLVPHEGHQTGERIMAPVCAVVVAGGSGQRFGNPGGKQLVNVAGRPLMSWSIRAFDRSDKVGHIVVVCPVERRAEMRRLAIDPFDYDSPSALPMPAIPARIPLAPACTRCRRALNTSPFTMALVRSLRPRPSTTLSTCS